MPVSIPISTGMVENPADTCYQKVCVHFPPFVSPLDLACPWGSQALRPAQLKWSLRKKWPLKISVWFLGTFDCKAAILTFQSPFSQFIWKICWHQRVSVSDSPHPKEKCDEWPHSLVHDKNLGVRSILPVNKLLTHVVNWLGVLFNVSRLHHNLINGRPKVLPFFSLAIPKGPKRRIKLQPKMFLLIYGSVYVRYHKTRYVSFP